MWAIETRMILMFDVRDEYPATRAGGSIAAYQQTFLETSTILTWVTMKRMKYELPLTRTEKVTTMSFAKNRSGLGSLAYMGLVRVARIDVVLSHTIPFLVLVMPHHNHQIVIDDLPRRVCVSSRCTHGRARCT